MAERLRAELALYQGICLQRWTAAMNDVRGPRRIDPDPPASTWPPHAVLEDRRRQAVPLPPGKDWPRDEAGNVL